MPKADIANKDLNNMSSSNWFRDTCATKVGDVVAGKGPVKSVDCRTTIAATLDLLNELGVTTIAVYGEVGHWLGDYQLVCGRKQYIGMISILDILSFLTRRPDAIETFLQNHISDTIGSTQETMTVWTESADRPLFFCMEQFCRGTHHAFCVGDPSVEPKMLSQSDLVAYVLSHETAMPHISCALDQTVGSIASAATDLVNVSDKLSDALRLLVKHHALPVVDSNGVVLSTLSASDMKGQLGAMVAIIAPMTVLDYLLYQNDNIAPSPFVVPATTTVRDAAKALLLRGMHRVWLQPETERSFPGVVSLTDVIRLIFAAELPT